MSSEPTAAEGLFSPGLEGVVAGQTAISTLTGGLNYRGYAIDDLAEHSSFDETAYLILHGELPTTAQFAAFHERIAAASHVPPEIFETLARIPATTPLMDVMRSGASLLAHWDPDVADDRPDAVLRKAERLLAQLPIVMAAAHRLRRGLPIVAPRPELSLAADVLWMVRGAEASESDVRALDLGLIMYAEHEYNASTFTARVVTSTLSDLHSAVVAAIGALKGPLHGGANERVLDVLQQVGSPDRAEAWVRGALARKEKIMGFGHRVYKAGDVRARYLKPICETLARATGHEPMEQMADVIEQIVTQEKGLAPNLDWPSARLFHYLGLAVELYTPLFVVSRITGWSAHVQEQSANNRLIRPRSRYVGPEPRRWTPAAAR